MRSHLLVTVLLSLCISSVLSDEGEETVYKFELVDEEGVPYPPLILKDGMNVDEESDIYAFHRLFPSNDESKWDPFIERMDALRKAIRAKMNEYGLKEGERRYPDAPKIGKGMLTKSYWKEILPDLHFDEASSARPIRVPKPLLKEMRDYYLQNGYINVPPNKFPKTQGDDIPARLKAATDKLSSMGIHPIWTWMSDELYDNVFIRGRQIWGNLVGRGFCVMPMGWVWHLGTKYKLNPTEYGFPIHRDKCLDADEAHDPATGLPNVLVVWTPLSDVTPDNGAMNVVPWTHDRFKGQSRHRDGTSLGYKVHNKSLGNYSATVDFSLQHIRTLPGPAGSMMAWSTDLMHWGGKCWSDCEENPRISAALVLLRHNTEAAHWCSRPRFSQRFSFIMSLISNFVQSYNCSDSMFAVLAEAFREYTSPEYQETLKADIKEEAHKFDL